MKASIQCVFGSFRRHGPTAAALSTAFEFATLWNDDHDEKKFFREGKIEKNIYHHRRRPNGGEHTWSFAAKATYGLSEAARVWFETNIRGKSIDGIPCARRDDTQTRVRGTLSGPSLSRIVYRPVSKRRDVAQ